MSPLITFLICSFPITISSQSNLTYLIRSKRQARDKDHPLCGLFKVDDGTVRVFEGSRVYNGEFPWLVVFHYSRISSRTGETLWNLKCNGAILNSRFVLTAAHCVDDKMIDNDLILYYGRRDITKTASGGIIEFRGILNVHLFPHEKFDREKGQNDIALIYLPDDIPLPESEKYIGDVNRICLFPKTPFKYEADFNPVIIAAFGAKTPQQVQAETNYATQASFKILPFNECKEIKETLSKDLSICLINSDAPFPSACPGDSGAPAIIKVDGSVATEPELAKETAYLVGVHSLGFFPRCGDHVDVDGLPYPFLETRVDAYHKWIKDTMKRAGNCNLAGEPSSRGAGLRGLFAGCKPGK